LKYTKYNTKTVGKNPKTSCRNKEKVVAASIPLRAPIEKEYATKSTVTSSTPGMNDKINCTAINSATKTDIYANSFAELVHLFAFIRYLPL
jgi:hypothetical protein